MIRLLLFAPLLLLGNQYIPAGPVFAHVAANCGSYTFCEAIIVDHTKIGSTDQSGFPVLVIGTTNTKTVGNGGKATNASGFDVTYYPTNGCTGTKLAWETEIYSASSTAADWWVLPSVTISHTVDTTIGYRCIGNAAVTTDQSNKTAVWDSNFVYVGHMPNGITLSASDSTSNANNGTLTNIPTATAGQIDGAANIVAASSQNIDLGSSSTLKIGGNITLEAWVQPGTLTGGFQRIISNLTSSSFTGAEILIHDASGGGASNVFYFQVGNAGSLQGATSTVAAVAGVTHQIVGLYDGSDGTIFIDGGGAGTHSFGAGAIGVSSVNTLIGAFTGNISNYNGWVDEVRISKIARSSDWILSEYNNQFSPSTFYSLVTQ